MGPAREPAAINSIEVPINNVRPRLICIPPSLYVIGEYDICGREQTLAFSR